VTPSPLAFCDLAKQHPAYWREVEPHFPALIMHPYMFKRMAGAELPGGQLVWTWFRWDGIPTGPVDIQQWASTKGRLWLADVVATRGVSGLDVGRTLRRELVSLGIAEEAERVYLQRMHSCRYGSFVARSGHDERAFQAGQEHNVQHPDLLGNLDRRPLGGHA